MSDDIKRKISKSHKGLPGTNTGKKFSDEHKRKIGQSNRGKKRSIKTLRKMSLIASKRIGNKAPNWKNGISKDKEHRRKKYKEWTKDNYDKKLWLNMQRRVMKLKANGSHTFGEWENLRAQYNWTCLACGKKEPQIKLTEDHIIPLSKGGSDNIENIQPLCRSCNSKKHTKIINYKING